MMKIRRLLISCLLDALLGDPLWLPHPVRIIGRAVKFSERLSSHFVKSQRGELITGALVSTFITAAAYTSTHLLLKFSDRINKKFGAITEIILASSALAMRSLITEANGVLNALEADDLKTARDRLRWIVGRDTEFLDENEIARAVIETVAESACDGIIAPLFYLTIGGPALALGYKAVNTLDSMIGHYEQPFTYFGRAAARLDDAANFLPARLTAGLIVVASKITGEDARSAAILWQRDGMLHASPNAGQSEAAMAGALNVRLGGVNYYDGVEHKSGYFGTEFTLPTARAARRSIRIVIAASVTAYAIAGLINWWRRK